MGSQSLCSKSARASARAGAMQYAGNTTSTDAAKEKVCERGINATTRACSVARAGHQRLRCRAATQPRAVLAACSSCHPYFAGLWSHTGPSAAGVHE